MTPAQLIFAMRDHAGLTQAELADLLGFRQASSVSNLERGHRENTSTKTIERVADACGVSVIYIAASDNDPGSWEIRRADVTVPF